ncbi:MAG: LPXTG cell wall anchor domain-containing protein, partial [Oscillospiraceae bacterium]|nr:LPXTG cell wall anchor domain-containing protein [Oscillospiraceae bacterium]
NGTVIKVYYGLRSDLSYTVEHYYDGETEPFDTDAVNNVTYGTEVTAVDDSDLLATGYVRTSVATLPATITANGTVIKVYYGLRSDLSYTVEHYYDGETEPFDTDAVNNVTYGTEVTAVDDSDLLAAGYVRTSVATLPATITANGTVIKVYYGLRSDLSYTVEHYYDGETEPFDTDAVNNVRYGTEVTVVDDSDLLAAGYVRTSVATLPATITANGTVIKVYYDLKSDLSYTVEYYYVGSETPFDTVVVNNVIHGTRVEDVVDSDQLAPGYKRDSLVGTPAEITKTGMVVKVYYAEKAPTDVEIPVAHNYYTDKLDGSTSADGSQAGTALVISVSEARPTTVDLSEVGKLLTFKGNNYAFVSIRVIGTLKDEFKTPVSDVPTDIVEVPVTTSDLALLNVDDEINVLSTTPDADVVLPTVVLAPTVEYTSNFVYQPEYDYEIEVTYSREEIAPEPDPEPEPDPTPEHNVPDRDPTPTVPIADPTVPLAPVPNNLVTILDPNMPLGNLPQTGGAGKLAAGAGLIGMLGAVLHALRKKKNEQ